MCVLITGLCSSIPAVVYDGAEYIPVCTRGSHWQVALSLSQTPPLPQHRLQTHRIHQHSYIQTEDMSIFSLSCSLYLFIHSFYLSHTHILASRSLSGKLTVTSTAELLILRHNLLTSPSPSTTVSESGLRMIYASGENKKINKNLRFFSVQGKSITREILWLWPGNVK